MGAAVSANIAEHSEIQGKRAKKEKHTITSWTLEKQQVNEQNWGKWHYTNFIINWAALIRRKYTRSREKRKRHKQQNLCKDSKWTNKTLENANTKHALPFHSVWLVSKQYFAQKINEGFFQIPKIQTCKKTIKSERPGCLTAAASMGSRQTLQSRTHDPRICQSNKHTYQDLIALVELITEY